MENGCDMRSVFNEVETVRKSAYIHDRVSASGGCEDDVTARTRCRLAKHRGCAELLHGRRFPPTLKEAAFKKYIRPAILHGSKI